MPELGVCVCRIVHAASSIDVLLRWLFILFRIERILYSLISNDGFADACCVSCSFQGTLATIPRLNYQGASPGGTHYPRLVVENITLSMRFLQHGHFDSNDYWSRQGFTSLSPPGGLLYRLPITFREATMQKPGSRHA